MATLKKIQVPLEFQSSKILAKNLRIVDWSPLARLQILKFNRPGFDASDRPPWIRDAHHLQKTIMEGKDLKRKNHKVSN